MGEISITKLLVVAALVVLLFGTKKLRTLGGDLGAAIKGFKKAMNDDDAAAKKGADVDLQAEKLSHKVTWRAGRSLNILFDTKNPLQKAGFLSDRCK